MPRKRSVGGRGRLPSIQNKLYLEMERTNKKLVQLSKYKMLGRYASKEIIRNVQKSSSFTFKSKGKQKIRLKPGAKPTESEARLFIKQSEKFRKSKTSTRIGIEEAKKRTKESIAQTLDREPEEEDVEDFYNLLGDSDFRHLADQIGPSEVLIIINEVEKNNGTVEDFIEKIKVYMAGNDEDIRERATRLWNKYKRR